MRSLILFIIVGFSFYAFTKKNNENKMQSFKWLEGSWTMKKKEWWFDNGKLVSP